MPRKNINLIEVIKSNGIFYYPYIHRTGKICGRRNYKPEGCHIHRKSPVCTPCRDCGKLNRSKHNACSNQVGKYQSRENYCRKKQDELRTKITMLENHTPVLFESRHEI
ncbi:hypothetical protein Glove_135g92 [Diversispora epigaea]|uniref:Uncharacterized protein n=1 Tax=Diversispora epigaea TaxID=1348612 RepID=A0A397J5H8_9GLOM|nr:hypothetical protein Glove_135g92 [Diversispora epigaea]